MSIGYLEIILGPMYASKSSILISKIRRERCAEYSVIMVKYSKDNRYVGNDPYLCTHDKMKYEAIRSSKTLDGIYDKVKKFDVIGIDEGQFFDDIVPFVNKLIWNDGKRVYIASLDSTSEGKKFGHVLDLIPICDTVHKLKAVCMTPGCRSDAILTHKKIPSKLEIEIGGKDKYVSLCRKCFEEAKEGTMWKKNQFISIEDKNDKL